MESRRSPGISRPLRLGVEWGGVGQVISHLFLKTFHSNAQAGLSSAKSQAESSQVHSFIDE